jgi:biopolymer transport protein ExbD
MAFKQIKAEEDVSPNLIPMIDIMFLLLLFFMLGADMGQRELEEVRLPKAEQAKVDPQNSKETRLTINAHHRTELRCEDYARSKVCRKEEHWKIVYRGEDVTEAAALALALDRTGGALPERRVMIRADAAAPFGLAQRAMNVCATKGIYRIEVGAATPPAH